MELKCSFVPFTMKGAWPLCRSISTKEARPLCQTVSLTEAWLIYLLKSEGHLALGAMDPRTEGVPSVPVSHGEGGVAFVPVCCCEGGVALLANSLVNGSVASLPICSSEGGVAYVMISKGCTACLREEGVAFRDRRSRGRGVSSVLMISNKSIVVYRHGL